MRVGAPGTGAGTSGGLSLVGWRSKCLPVACSWECRRRVAESPLVPRSDAAARVRGELEALIHPPVLNSHVLFSKGLCLEAPVTILPLCSLALCSFVNNYVFLCVCGSKYMFYCLTFLLAYKQHGNRDCSPHLRLYLLLAHDRCSANLVVMQIPQVWRAGADCLQTRLGAGGPSLLSSRLVYHEGLGRGRSPGCEDGGIRRELTWGLNRL